MHQGTSTIYSARAVYSSTFVRAAAEVLAGSTVRHLVQLGLAARAEGMAADLFPPTRPPTIHEPKIFDMIF